MERHPSRDIALVAISPSRVEAVRGVSWRATSSFIAHLIAIEEHAPQTCERRRAEAGEAAHAYAAAARLTRRRWD